MPESPYYARFYKCDLQMQTPLSPHWLEASSQVSQGASDADKLEAARLFLRGCHDASLDVVGITDHNFAPSATTSFIPYLREQNETVADDMGRRPLTILPGFEVQANVGKGCHVICLFPPDTPVEVVDARLTALGLPVDTRFDGSKPQSTMQTLDQIINVVQDSSQFPGLVIPAHIMSDKGLFDSDRISDWIQQREFLNPKLLCVELPKHPDEMSLAFQRLFRGGPDCEEDWRRAHPIAFVMSSDCYRIARDAANPTNHIGVRHTWIRMSDPSGESLRQAFLDADSRIRFGDDDPTDQYRHARILGMSVRGATFLRRLEPISWSPNLNCIIGSRGTGKSTIIDYMRLLLDRLDEMPQDLFRSSVQSRVFDTLSENSVLEMEFQTASGFYRVTYGLNDSPQRRIYEISDSRSPQEIELNIKTLFPCRFLSQHEIDHIVNDLNRASLRGLLDGFITQDLDRTRTRAQDATAVVRELDTRIAALQEKQSRSKDLFTQRHELEGKLNAVPDAASVLANWKRAEEERQLLEQARNEALDTIEEYRGITENLQPSVPTIPEAVSGGPANDHIERTYRILNSASQKLRADTEAAVKTFETSTTRADSELTKEFDSWRPLHEKAAEQLQLAEHAGVDLGELQSLPSQIAAIVGDIKILEDELAQLPSLISTRKSRVQDLKAIWEEDYQLRLATAKQLMSELTPSGSPNPLVRIHVNRQSDRQQINAALAVYIGDRRSLNDEDLNSVLVALNQSASFAPEVPLMDRFIKEVRAGLKDSVVQSSLPPTRRATLLERFDESIIQALEVVRIEDTLEYYVHRSDGTLAGAIEKVSAGQQGTAIMNLLLASGSEPLIVDTPEEGLDSEGVYAELVPLFRNAKESRQIIVATHNANIPVNADAELIIALEAAGFLPPDIYASIASEVSESLTDDQIALLDGRLRWPNWQTAVFDYVTHDLGWPASNAKGFVERLGPRRETESRLYETHDSARDSAIGALDKVAVKNAVQSIMEGSQEAFLHRYDMYGF